MKKLLAIVLIALLGVSSLAQETPFQPSCSLTLQSNPSDFMEEFTTKNNDGSEAGQDNAALYWADCMAKRNAARLVNFPTLKAKIMNLYRSQNQFFDFETELAYAAAGGGTMFPHGRARFQPTIEEHMVKMIDLLTTKAGAAKSTAITARYNKAKFMLEARMKRVQATSKAFTEGYSSAEITQKNKAWFDTAKQYALQFSNIRKNLGSSVDLASTTILEFLARGLWADEL